jgi:hypothetical protein
MIPRFTTLLLVAALLAGQATLGAQTFTGMLVAGVNLSQIDGDKLAGFNKPGLTGGVRVSARLTDRWHLSTEMLYSPQGANQVARDDISSPYSKIRLNLVEAPVMIHFNDWKIQAGAGLSYGRIINTEVIGATGEDLTALEDYRTDIVSIVFGGTYYFSEKMGFNINWSRHLTNLKKKQENEEKATFFVGRTLALRLYYIL